MLKNFNKVIAAVAITLAFGMAAAPAEAGDQKAWMKAIAKKIAKKQKYPRSALAREIEGRARVRITIAADGVITAHEIIQSTGQKILDREIPKLIKRLSPLPATPNGKERSIVLPINWRLA